MSSPISQPPLVPGQAEPFSSGASGQPDPSADGSSRSLHNMHQVPGENYHSCNPEDGVPDLPLPERKVQPENPALAPISKDIKELLDEQWAAGNLKQARDCLDDPELAEQYKITITVVLPDTGGREVSVAPPEKGMSAEELKPYIEAARAGLAGMEETVSKHNSQYYQDSLSSLKERYEQQSEGVEQAQDWEAFFANLQKSRSKEFSCTLESGAVVKFATGPVKGPGKPTDRL